MIRAEIMHGSWQLWCCLLYVLSGTDTQRVPSNVPALHINPGRLCASIVRILSFEMSLSRGKVNCGKNLRGCFRCPWKELLAVAFCVYRLTPLKVRDLPSQWIATIVFYLSRPLQGKTQLAFTWV